MPLDRAPQLAGKARVHIVALGDVGTTMLIGLLLAGLHRGVRGLRYAGLALFAVVVGKIFLVDLAGLESIYRILAFIALGILLFLAALLYLRNRARFQQGPE